MTDYIDRMAVRNELYEADAITMQGVKIINQFPAAQVVDADDYTVLLHAARKMHEWIFLHTGDEQKAYDECGLSDEMNMMLGYGGKIEITPLEPSKEDK